MYILFYKNIKILIHEFNFIIIIIVINYLLLRRKKFR